MYSYTINQSTTFTVTHARHMAAKVSADLKRMQRFYGYPRDSDIADYEIEVTELLKAGYLDSLTVGFMRNNQWVEPTLRYTACDLVGMMANDDDPGRVLPGRDVSGATFYSYLTYSATWERLTASEKDSFKRRMPFYRKPATQPTVNGYLIDDKTYSAGGRALGRASLRAY
ncbi:HORMA-1 domain-containing protein [Xylella fastidiosa]